MTLISVLGRTPQIGEGGYLAPSSILIGDVILGEKSSVWFHAVLRGDVMPIRIGRETNIQDGTVIHGTYKEHGVSIGDRVTVGHNVTLHGCTIGDEVLVGMGAIVMDGVKISSQCVVGAGSLLTQGTEFPPGSLILGRPAKVVRKLNEQEIAFLKKSADNYQLYKTWYEEENHGSK